jgi:hypothetical protein
MKKLIVLAVAFTVFIASASAQSIRGGDRKYKTGNGYHSRELTPGERYKLKKNDVRYHRTARKFKRDGRLSRTEKRKLYQMKRHDRHDTYRYKHNRRSF